MEEHRFQIGSLLKKWIHKEPSTKKPHPAIFKIEPEHGICGICDAYQLLTYLDRETGDLFCTECLPCAVLADRQLATQLARPGYVI